ncbi:MAG: hypothetical protein LUH02_08555 [Erysipelotrichaceae bacterium]|nr:hypothetical protein [Erysipelotrichaceae bacterium]
MNITAEEKIMYEVMKAIYNSGIPIDFKGSMVLKACLIELGYIEEVRHTMDIDVNRSSAPTKIYEVADLCFRGVTPSQMIADKLFVISTDKIFRRIKDLIDLYYMSNVICFNKDDIMNILVNNKRVLGDFNGFLYRKDDLKHAYDKFRLTGNVNKLPFDELYLNVKTYINDVLPRN